MELSIGVRRVTHNLLQKMHLAFFKLFSEQRPLRGGCLASDATPNSPNVPVFREQNRVAKNGNFILVLHRFINGIK